MPKQATVFAGELIHTRVPYLLGCTSDIVPTEREELACLVQAQVQVLLVLKRAYRGHSSEIVVKCGNSHIGSSGQLIQTKGLSIIGTNSHDC